MRRLVAWVGLLASAGMVGCVGGEQSAAEDGGAGTGSSCVRCDVDCFDCGSGCVCVPDASVGLAPWMPPFNNLGAPGGWRDTNDTTFCPGTSALDALDLWSDSRGVYVMLAGATAVEIGPAPTSDAGASDMAGAGGGTAGSGGLGSDCVGTSCTGEAVLFNDGRSGWQRIHQRRELSFFGSRHLSGVSGGPQVLYGGDPSGFDSTQCSLGRLQTGEWLCDRNGGRRVSAVFGVNETLAYAAIGNELIRFDGTAWSAYGPIAPGEIGTLWADDTDVVAVDLQGLAMLLRDGVWTTPFSGVARNLWGSAANDLWFTDVGRGLWHFDGEAASLVAPLPASGCVDGDVGLQLWGSGDALYIYGDRSLYRWNGTKIEELVSWVCSGNGAVVLTRVWGNGPNEVFVLLRDFNRLSSDACGEGAVMYFDGTTFHAI